MLTEEQKKNRMAGLGGSDMPVVLGLSPYKSRSELWAEKRGLAEEEAPSPAMLRGTHLEPVAADLYAERTGRKLRRSNLTQYHKESPFLLCHIDRQIVAENGRGPGILEIKCPGVHVFRKCQREGLPPHYLVQLLHNMMVTNRTWGSFAVFSAERWEMIQFDVDQDPEIVAAIMDQGGAFWKAVQEGTPVQDDAPDAGLIKGLPPVEPSEIVTVDSPQWAEAIRSLAEAKEIAEEAAAIEESAKAEIQSIMDKIGATVVEGAGARIYWRTQAGRETFDHKRLIKDYPEQDFTKYVKRGSPFRSFRSYFLTQKGKE